MINLQYSAPLVSLTYDRGITRCHDGQVHLWSIASNMENVRAPQLPPELQFKIEQKWMQFQCRECDVNTLNRCNVESGRVNKSNHSWNVENRGVVPGPLNSLSNKSNVRLSIVGGMMNKEDEIEENQRKFFKSILKIRFCDSGCHLKTSSIQPAKVLVFVSINDWNTFDK